MKKRNVNSDQLKLYLKEGLSVPLISSLMNVSVSTIRRTMSKENLYVRDFDDVTDEELEQFVRETLSKNPTWGFKRVQGLSRNNLRVQKLKLREIYARVVGATRLPGRPTIVRRAYFTRAPMSMWHMDTCHQLITFKYVIFGATDGFSRYVMFLQLANNNTAATCFQHFHNAVKKYGLPSRVRSDQGGENVIVADYMISKRGVGRSSFITGSSTHNTRIERLWLEVLKGTTSTFYNLFYQMVEEGILNPDEDVDLYCLHTVTFDLLQKALDDFTDSWNRHSLATEGEKTPRQLFIAGMAQLLNSQNNRPIFDELNQTADINWDPSYHNARRGERSLNWRGKKRVRRIQCPLLPRESALLDEIFDSNRVSLTTVKYYYCWVKQYVQLCTSLRNAI